MAIVANGNQIKLNNGKTVQAEQGGWYDGQQFWGGTLSQAGQINSQSNQVGAGQAVSKEVIAQTNPANVAYIEAERKKAGLAPSPSVTNPTPQAVQSPQGLSSGTSGLGSPMVMPETINLPKLYESLYGSSGIREIESDLSSKTDAYNQQVAKIKDNPYLSEATMTGRIKKLDDKFRADTANVQNDIAMRKADVETKLNLESKQFDINSEATQRAWQQFNTLLGSGALDNASGEDIANITRSTGISSSMINSAIGASKAKNEPKRNTQVIQSTSDNGEVTVSVIDQDTGEIVNQQSLGRVGNAQTGAKEKELPPDQAVGQILKSYLSNKGQQAQISPEDLYRELLLQYPGARTYLEQNFSPQQIRSILGN